MNRVYALLNSPFGLVGSAPGLAALALALIVFAPAAPARADLGDPVVGCGTITGGVECPTFTPDSGGMFLLSDLGGFPPGTHVYVEGVVGGDCHELCLFIIPVPCVTVRVIRLCDPLPPVRFDGCGTITGGVDCPTFVSDEGEVYFLNDFGGFEVGSRVLVHGLIGSNCFALCDLAAPCIEVTSVQSCPAPPGRFDGCGQLVQGTTCVLFQSDYDGTFVLDQFGGFGVGDRVRLSGAIDYSCATLCMEGEGCILADTIGRCTRDAGDFDGSGCTNLDDFLFLLDNWQEAVSGISIDIDDFLALLDYWLAGASC